MKTTELRKLSQEELEQRVREAKRELMDLRFQAVSGRLVKTSELRRVRTDIARMKTVANQLGRKG
ncbi:MAG: 50S ribosomal protein L29 [Nitrospirota bacterium]|jgi:large subunit ribosomal protein L29